MLGSATPNTEAAETPAELWGIPNIAGGIWAYSFGICGFPRYAKIGPDGANGPTYVRLGVALNGGFPRCLPYCSDPCRRAAQFAHRRRGGTGFGSMI